MSFLQKAIFNQLFIPLSIFIFSFFSFSLSFYQSLSSLSLSVSFSSFSLSLFLSQCYSLLFLPLILFFRFILYALGDPSLSFCLAIQNCCWRGFQIQLQHLRRLVFLSFFLSLFLALFLSLSLSFFLFLKFFLSLSLSFFLFLKFFLSLSLSFFSSFYLGLTKMNLEFICSVFIPLRFK